MKIVAPKFVIIALAALFSSYHVVLAAYSLSFPYASDAAPVIVAIVLYAAATLVSLLPTGSQRMPVWVSVFVLAVAVSLPLIVTSVLQNDREGGNGYGTWYVAAVGTLLTIAATRYRAGFAWAGIAFLVVQSLLWAGPGSLGPIGVIGSAAWVGVAHIITNTLTKAARDSQQFAMAEREATEWQAAQDAHLSERQFRLGQTGVMALPMLQTIRRVGGDLSEDERLECLHLEGAIRDEIRGRKLLDDRVREQVMLARRRGTVVTLLDEGGIDELDDDELVRVHGALAEALRGTRAEKVIVRTVPEGSDVAVTVVGLDGTGDGAAALLGRDEEEEVSLWLEIPRIEVERADL
ncbi:hypothetical protein [Schumannella soli]|uniref:hypothetical protein n=1 Tax=Schumannella soli TaxID=2590779 RepID=UPI0015E869C6|nr:hypothetical protein [Schumannella soli]